MITLDPDAEKSVPRRDRLLALADVAQRRRRIDLEFLLGTPTPAALHASPRGSTWVPRAHAVRIEALRRLGEILKASDKARGGGEPGVGRRGKNAVPTGNRIPAPTLAEVGLTKKQSSIAQTIAALPPPQFEKVRDGAIPLAGMTCIAVTSRSGSGRSSPLASHNLRTAIGHL